MTQLVHVFVLLIYESYAILFTACVVAASLAAVIFVYATVSLTQLCACNQLYFTDLNSHKKAGDVYVVSVRYI